MMKRKILLCLLVLALLLPAGSAVAVTAMGDVRVTADHGQNVTLTTAAFLDSLQIDPGDHGIAVVSIAFPTLPPAETAVIRQGGTDYPADTEVTVGEISRGGLQIRAAESVTIPFRATLDNAGTLTANLVIDVQAVNAEPPEILHYRDMASHWAAYAAGRLAVLDKVVGQQVDHRYFFFPDSEITRGDFVVWLCSVMGMEPAGEGHTLYADPDTPGWLGGYLNAATEAGIIQGSPAGCPAVTSYFNPHHPVTRIEAIRMVSIALGVEGHDDDLSGLFADMGDVPGWGKNHVRHLAERRIINGDSAGYLHPQRTLRRGEAAEMLYRLYREREV
ncbi:MAG: S-layer homology domain-containing protein [Oscillospiraceae bacterium]|nr:S-layer homology domain-containing protein [Oscillospiraceae bacterium]